MAQVPKQRLTLYIVIGVIAVGFGVWFMIQAQKQKKAMSGHRVFPYQVNKQTTHLRNELEQASRRTEGIAEAPDLIGRIEAAIAEFSAGYNEADSSASEDLTQKRGAIDDMIGQLRKLKKAAR